MCWMLINWKKRIFGLFWTLEMKFSSLWSLQTLMYLGRTWPWHAVSWCMCPSFLKFRWRWLGKLQTTARTARTARGLWPHCFVQNFSWKVHSLTSCNSIWKMSVNFLDGWGQLGYTTIPSPFPCIRTEVISLGRHLHAWQRRGQDEISRFPDKFVQKICQIRRFFPFQVGEIRFAAAPEPS